MTGALHGQDDAIVAGPEHDVVLYPGVEAVVACCRCTWQRVFTSPADFATVSGQISEHLSSA